MDDGPNCKIRGSFSIFSCVVLTGSEVSKQVGKILCLNTMRTCLKGRVRKMFYDIPALA